MRISGKYDSAIEYHGIAADEAERTKKNKTKDRIIEYPLVEWGMVCMSNLREYRAGVVHCKE